MRLWHSSAGVAAIALTLGLQAFWLGPADLRNEDQTLAIPHWPAACDGVRVAVLADLHTGSPWNGVDKLDAIVEMTRAAEPDLILLAGDYVISGVPGGTFVPPERIAQGLAPLEAPLGVFAVMGNHDWARGSREVRAALQGVGIPMLDDTAIEIRRGDCTFWLAGIGDWWVRRRDYARALRRVPEQAPVIAFTHNPDVFVEAPARVSLTVAGHTHGGQVVLPFLGRLIVPSNYGERFAIGHVVEGGRHLFVSPGLGTSILPVRFGVPPEISVLTLVAAQSWISPPPTGRERRGPP